MTVWLRLLLTFIACRFRKKFSGSRDFVDNYFSTTFRVWPTEADGSLLNNARYFTFAEATRLELMLRSGIFKVVLQEKITPLVGSQTIRYLKPLRRFQKFTLHTRLLCWDAKWFYLEHRFERNKKPVALAYIKVCGIKNGHTISPADVLAKAGFTEGSKDIPLVINKWKETDELLAVS